MTDDEQDLDETGWLSRLKHGLGRTSDRLVGGITGLVSKRRLDDEVLEELEELLITSDMGVSAAGRAVQSIARTRFGKEVEPEEILEALAEELAVMLAPVTVPFEPDPEKKPFVVLVCGVNGSGKTTTIGKLAKQQADAGKRVLLAAADTFRAAAVEQLNVWGGRSNCPVVSRDPGADAASLAFDAVRLAQHEGMDVLFIDTAGRLQNKSALMDELKKIVRVINKLDETAPHACLLVLDATVGQNALTQVESFKEMVAVDGLVMTKLDGTAKGGVLVALADRVGLPVHAVGVGEAVEDLRPFEARAFARNLMGLEA